MSGAITDLSRTTLPAGLTAEVLIIGSGCGGATAARVLAEAGRDVLVLEEGGDFTGAQLDLSEAERYDQLYMDRGGRMTADTAVSVLQGRVLGGGGVINACDVVPLSDEVLAFWRRRFGLSDFTPEALEPFRKRALQDLSASRIEEAQINRANGLLRQGAESLGLRGEVMLHNRDGCLGLGTCLIGCPADAKRNPRLVAIPAALAAGARFYTRTQATRIDDAEKDTKRITVRTLDPKGYHETGSFEIRAKTVIVAANAVGTAQLLLRSGLGNEHVGRNLMLQPQLPVVAEFDEKVEAFYGIPQAYAVTHYEEPAHEKHGLWGFRIEAVMGTPGIVSALLPVAGVEGKDLMSRYPRLAASLLLVPDEPSGTVEVDGSGRAVLRYEQRDNHRQRLREAIKAAARVYLAAGAKRVIVPVLPPLEIRSEADLAAADALGFAPATAPLVSAHQQGAVRFAPSANDGAADPDGQVYGTRGVYVFDSSGFPSSASSHTMAPIIAVSHYLSAKLTSRLA
jgi:choline dehydrogenase-like flavoprotein